MNFASGAWGLSGAFARAIFLALTCIYLTSAATKCMAAGGVLMVATEDETGGVPVVSRMELTRADGKPQVVRRVASAGRGVCVPATVELALPDGSYQFHFSRGPEYRLISGNFVLERTSNDQKTVRLPRMAHLLPEGWLSVDMAVPADTSDLRLRMMADDLHFANVLGQPGRDTFPQALPKDDSPYRPLWTTSFTSYDEAKEVLFFGEPSEQATAPKLVPGEFAVEAIDRFRHSLASGSDSRDDHSQAEDATADGNSRTRIAVANPFAWSLPIWLATESVDGFMLLGDWLRLDKKVVSIAKGRPPEGIGFGGSLGPGRYAEFIYWQMLESGFAIAPIAGTGLDAEISAQSPIGYNRVYVNATRESVDDTTANVAESPFESPPQVMQAIWDGRTFVTNGPLLRPTLGGFPPGERFTASGGERLQLQMELKLSVRDPVDYLEIIHDGKVFYSARLDEFAKAGGVLPELIVDKSGWALVRVVTRHEDHFRMATSAPWYFQFDGRPRISKKAVQFFQRWLADAERELRNLPADQVKRHAVGVVRARKFWADRLLAATDD